MTEHWRSSTSAESGPSITDVWVSTDERFPLTLRVERKTPVSTLSWRIAKLDLATPVPDYMFTPQVDPRGGLTYILLRRNTPFSTIAWYSLTLLAYTGALFSLASRRRTWRFTGRLLVGGISLLAMCFLFGWWPRPGMTFYLFSDTPAMLIWFLLAAVFIAFVFRVLGRPGSVSVFRGTTWASVLFILAALVIGAWNQHYSYVSFVEYVGLAGWRLQFLGAPLVNVTLYAASWAAVEEVAFRGYLYHALQSKLRSVWLAIAIQAVIFGAYHLPGQIQSNGVNIHLLWTGIGLTLFGIVVGILRWRYRNLGVPWLVHLASNVGELYAGYLGVFATLQALERL